MLAINSDVEWTGWSVQMALIRALHERNLETAHSFWMFCDPLNTWSLFDEDVKPTRFSTMAFGLARVGLFDTNHAIGGRAHSGGCKYDRRAICRAYELLAAEGMRPAIYSNHGTELDIQNVAGKWARYQQGDLPGSPLYHLDVTVASGVRYFCCDPDYATDRTALSARVGTDDGLFVADRGRDGTPLLRFRRFLGVLQQGPSLDNLHLQIAQILDAGNPGYTIVYQHLGVERLPDGKSAPATAPPFQPAAIDALDRLARCQAAGEVLVTTTSRLLDHAALMTARPWTMTREAGRLTVEFSSELRLGGASWPLTWDAVQGWAVPDTDIPVVAKLRGQTRELSRFRAGNALYVGLPWPRLDTGAAIAAAERLSVGAGT